MDIQVGDRVTYQVKDSIKDICIVGDTIELNSIIENIEKGEFEILKIERLKYEIIEKKKELLIEKERKFLKQFIDFSDYIIDTISKSKHRVNFYSDKSLVETIEIKEGCMNKLNYGKKYTISELRIGGISMKDTDDIIVKILFIVFVGLLFCTFSFVIIDENKYIYKCTDYKGDIVYCTRIDSYKTDLKGHMLDGTVIKITSYKRILKKEIE